MGARQRATRTSKLGLGVGLAIIIVGVGLISFQVIGGRHQPIVNRSNAFYTADEGKTFFTASGK